MDNVKTAEQGLHLELPVKLKVNMDNLTTVGQKIPKRDAPPKVIGAAQYIQDIKVPGMLHGKILYSKHPHARILKLDTSKAEKLAGVRAVPLQICHPPSG